jgi:hypothetical protein
MILSVTPTNKCDKEKRCKYCYLSQKRGESTFEQLYEKMCELIEVYKPNIVTFAYNKGFSPALFEKLLERAHSQAEVSVTLQTDCIKYLDNSIKNIDYVALSLKTSNLNEIDIRTMCNDLRNKKNIKIGINFLMNELPTLRDLITFFKSCQDCFEQFHFLLPKRYGITYELKDAINIVKVMKMMFPGKVFVDECLKTIITNTPCSRHGNLLSLNADASVTMCSFADIDDKETLVEKCPYLVTNS